MEVIKNEKVEEMPYDDELSVLDQKIIHQVEYYFSDFNLPQDKFLQEQTSIADGWVTMEVMLKFNRLARLTEDADVILAALKKSKSGLLEISVDSQKIRRSKEKPIPEDTEERKQQIIERTVHCGGLPREGVEMYRILEFFEALHSVENVKALHRQHLSVKSSRKSGFTGSVNVTFTTRETAEKFIQGETVRYGDNDLTRKWLSDWEREEEEAAVLATDTLLRLANVPKKTNHEEIKTAFSEYSIEITYVEKTANRSAIIWLRAGNEVTQFIKKLEDVKITLRGNQVGVSLIQGAEQEELLNKLEKKMNKGGGGRQTQANVQRGQKRLPSAAAPDNSPKKNKVE